MSEENKIIEGSVVVLKSDIDNEHKIKMTVHRIYKESRVGDEMVADLIYFDGGIILKERIRLTSLHKIS